MRSGFGIAQARKQGNAEAMQELMVSNARRVRGYAQGLNAMKNSIDGFSAEVYMKDAIDRKLADIKVPTEFKEKKKGWMRSEKEKVATRISDARNYIKGEAKKVKSKLNKTKLSIKEAQKFIDSLACPK